MSSEAEGEIEKACFDVGLIWVLTLAKFITCYLSSVKLLSSINTVVNMPEQ